MKKQDLLLIFGMILAFIMGHLIGQEIGYKKGANDSITIVRRMIDSCGGILYKTTDGGIGCERKQ